MLDPLLAVIEAADTLRAAFSPFLNCDYTIFSKPLSVFESAQTASAHFAAVVREASYKVENIIVSLQQEKDQKEAVLSNLRRNIKDYPKGLLQLRDRLSDELHKQTAQRVQIDILADVLEISESEEQWRNAVEGYLNFQKFYLLVDPRHYKQAVYSSAAFLWRKWYPFRLHHLW